MAMEKNMRDRIFITTVVIFSLAGILYFGYRAIRSHSRSAQINPFEYDIERYREIDRAWFHYG